MEATTSVDTGEWLVVQQLTFFDPRVVPFLVEGVYTTSNQDYFIVPVGVVRLNNGGLAFVTPTDARSATVSIPGDYLGHFFTFDCSEILAQLRKVPGFKEGDFAGVDYVNHYIRAKMPGDRPKLWWDYIAVLTLGELMSAPWVGHNQTVQPIWDSNGSNILQSTGKGNAKYYLPPKGFLKNPDGSAAFLINSGGFSEMP